MRKAQTENSFINIIHYICKLYVNFLGWLKDIAVCVYMPKETKKVKWPHFK